MDTISQQDSELDAQKKLAKDLWEAVDNDDVIKVRSLLVQGADPNHHLYWSDEWDKDPPLHRACWWGYLEVAKTLVTHGARTDKGGGSDNMTPLHYACRGGHKEMVEYLILELGCSTDVRDKDNMTPLHYACLGGRKEMVEYLIQELGCSTDVRDKYNKTPLHWACEWGHKHVVQYLVEEAKCYVDVRDDKGQSPLDKTLDDLYVCMDVALYLMSCGYACGDEDKAKLLCAACYWGKLGAVKELVEQHKVDPKNVRDDDNWTPLHNACLRGHKDVVQYLVEMANCDINGRDDEGQSPLDRALDDMYDDGCADVALYLMSRGCGGDEDKAKLLCEACLYGMLDVVKELVQQHKVDPKSVTGGDGRTPLDLATQNGHTEITDYLKSLPQQSAVTGDSDSRSEENGPTPTKKRKGAQPVTQRVCPNCEESCHIRCKKCPECEHEFPPSTKSRAKPDQDSVKNPSNLLQILQKKVDQLSLVGFDIVVLVHRDSSKSHDPTTKSHDSYSRSRHTYRKFVTPGLAESFVKSPLVYGSWKDFCSTDKTSTGNAQKSKNKTNPRNKKGVQANTTAQEGGRSHDTSGVSHDQSNVSQDSNGPNTQSQAAQSSTAPLSIGDNSTILNAISSLNQRMDSIQSSLNAPPTHYTSAYPPHMYPSTTGLMNTRQSTFVPRGGPFNTPPWLNNTPPTNHFIGPSHNSMLGQPSLFPSSSLQMYPFSTAPANYRFPPPITSLQSSRQPMNSDPNTDSIDTRTLQ